MNSSTELTPSVQSVRCAPGSWSISLSSASVRLHPLFLPSHSKNCVRRDRMRGGDEQIPVAYSQELLKLQRAFRNIGQTMCVDYAPKLTFTIVTKRVNTRFFEARGDSILNPPSGTVVDSVVTRKERYDFFLVPQCVRQGTVTPVSYNVIFDSSGLTPDQQQRLAYKLCHLYYNWQGTIRVPAPCQYAHKLAFLVGQSLHRPPHHLLADKLFFL